MVPGLARWLLLTLLLCGCASTPAVRDQFYQLTTSQTASELARRAPTPLHPGTLLVTNIAARGFLGGLPIVFREDQQPALTQRYDNHLWEQPPARMLKAQLVRTLDSAGLFRHVLADPSGAQIDYRLSGQLTRFEHRPTAQPPTVALELELTLIEAATRRLVFVRRYTQQQPTAASTPAAMVAAFNQLVDRVLDEIIADLRTI